MPDNYTICPLGDSAATINFGNVIDMTVHKKVVGLYRKLLKYPIKGMIEAVACYASVTIYYNPIAVGAKIGFAFEQVRRQLEAIVMKPEPTEETPGRQITIPVCYDKECAPDLKEVAAWAGLNADDVIGLHSSQQYHVYMVGFLPGFAYMGNVPASIAMPRKAQPEKVAAGSVGIAGIQTGIYPLDSPGGWQIIGKTPLKIIDVAQQPPCMFNTGDIVHFKPITRRELESFERGHA